MAKNSGGTRNYRKNPKALSTRRKEFDRLMHSGFYDVSRSYFDPSGGFVATNKEHNEVEDQKIDKEKKKPHCFSPMKATKFILTMNVLQ